MSYRDMKLRKERQDEIRKLDAEIARLRDRIRDLETAIMMHASRDAWAMSLLQQEDR